MVSCRFKNWTAVFYDSKTFPWRFWSCVGTAWLYSELRPRGAADLQRRAGPNLPFANAECSNFQRDAVSKNKRKKNAKPTLQWKIPPPSNGAARLEEEAGSKHENALRVSTLARLTRRRWLHDYSGAPPMHAQRKWGWKQESRGQATRFGWFFFFFTVYHMGLRGSTGLFRVGICIFFILSKQSWLCVTLFFSFLRKNLVFNCAGSQSFPRPCA